MKKEFTPNFRTPRHEFSREENNKLMAHLRYQEMFDAFRDKSHGDVEWQIEALAKSHGIYMEFDRSKTGEEKDWMYMIRISVTGGGPITPEQWKIVDELSDKYTQDNDGHPSIRFTTRQNIQFHWIRKHGVVDVVKRLAEGGWNSLNGCGDNTRNVMGCPCSRYSDVFNAHEWAHWAGKYFQLPLDPFIKVYSIDPKFLRVPEESFQYGPNLLNRKFKIAFSTVHKDANGKIVADNCVEHRTNDLSVAPIVENGKVTKFQVYVGGGQGERNGKASMATLGIPLCRCSGEQLKAVLDAVVKVHMDWGDRQNRVWARVKYVVKKMGIDWYRDQVSVVLGFPLEKPDLNLDYGAREMHYGWMPQPTNGLLSYGMFIENGRITDNSPNGKLKSLIKELMKKYPIELMITPNQDAIFQNIPPASKNDFEANLKKFGYGLRNNKPYSTLRLLSGACVGRDTCRLTYTDSEKFEPFLIDELEALGWSDFHESIGITGCERQCFRPATKTIGLVGTGLDRYQMKLFGSEDARHQGTPLISGDGQSIYLRSIPRERVAQVLDILFKFYKENAKSGEDLGSYHRRIGPDAIISYLKSHPTTADLMVKPFPTDCVID